MDINIFPEKGGDTSLRITILDEKKTDRQVMQTLVLLIPHFSVKSIYLYETIATVISFVLQYINYLLKSQK